MASVHIECENAFVTSIQALSLTGVTSAEIVARRRAFMPTISGSQGYIHRGITVHPVGRRKAIGTNEREDVGYGVGITVILPQDHSSTTNRDLAAPMLDSIHDKLVEDRPSITLPSGANFLTIKWEFRQVQVPKEFFNYDISSMVAWCWVRRSRT